MSRQVALFICFGFIIFLLQHDYKKNPAVSAAHWIPLIWIFIVTSRAASSWIYGTSRQVVAASTAYLEGSPFDRNVYSLLIVASLVILITRKFQCKNILSKNVWLLFFFGYCAISSIWSDYHFVSFKRWTKAVGEIIVILVIFTEVNPAEAAVAVLKRCAFFHISLSVLFINYYPALGRSYNRSGWVDYHGVAMQKNSLGVLCMIYGIVIFSDLLIKWEQRNKNPDKTGFFSGVLLMLMIFWLLHKCQSATSLMCLLLGIGLMVSMNIKIIKEKIHLAPAICGVLFILFLGVQSVVDIRSIAVSSIGRDMTLTGRTDIWKQVLERVDNPLLGTGYMSYWLGERIKFFWEESNWQFRLNTSHNGYIETYINLGIIGVAILLIWLISGYNYCIRTFKTDFAFGRMSLAIMVTFFIHNITEASFQTQTINWLAFLLTCGIKKGTVVDADQTKIVNC
jgi:exopolysaccharide production protein ExoQ